MLTKEKIYLIEEQTGVRQNELRRSLNEELRGGARKGPQQSAAGLYRDGYPQGFEMIGNDGNTYYLNHQRMGKNNKMTAKWVKVKNTQANKKKMNKKAGRKKKIPAKKPIRKKTYAGLKKLIESKNRLEDLAYSIKDKIEDVYGEGTLWDPNKDIKLLQKKLDHSLDLLYPEERHLNMKLYDLEDYKTYEQMYDELELELKKWKKIQPKKGGKKSGGKSKFMKINPKDCPAQFFVEEGESFNTGIEWMGPKWVTVEYIKLQPSDDKTFMWRGGNFEKDTYYNGIYSRYEGSEHVYRVYNKKPKKPKANWKSIKIPDNDNFDLDDYDSDQDDDDISSPKKKGLKCNDAGECIDCCDEGLKGDITDSKKYCNRNSPPYAANHYKCQGTTKEGNDGNMYTSTENKNGVYTWKKSKAFKREKWGKVYGKPPTSLAKSQKVIDTVLQFVQKPILAAAFEKHATPYNSAFKKKHKITARDTVYVVNSKFKIVKAKSISKNLYVYDQSFLQKLFEIIAN